jgi:hypothetical protein
MMMPQCQNAFAFSVQDTWVRSIISYLIQAKHHPAVLVFELVPATSSISTLSERQTACESAAILAQYFTPSRQHIPLEKVDSPASSPETKRHKRSQLQPPLAPHSPEICPGLVCSQTIDPSCASFTAFVHLGRAHFNLTRRL